MTYRDPLFATARNETKTLPSHGQDNRVFKGESFILTQMYVYHV